MKTAEFSSSTSGTHRVGIDLQQLWRYLQRPLGQQPFYVIPYVDWSGTLEAAVASDGMAPTEVAFRRSGDYWWFAEWLFVLTARQVAAVLATELAHASAMTGGEPSRQQKTLVKYKLPKASPGEPPTTSWGHNGQATPPDVVWWRDFWSELVKCGRPGWPQIIRIPADGPLAGPLSRTQVLQRLQYAQFGDGERGQEMWTLEPDADDQFVPIDQQRRTPDSANDGVQEFRQVVVLDAQALIP
jgi:hypothetical protein